MATAYSYVRFSTPAQARGDSLRRQLARTQRFADARGLELDTSLRDLGLSAYKSEHRHKGALGAFLRRVQAGEVERGSYLIVENLDRLSREQVLPAVSMFLQIIEAGIVVATLNDDMIYSVETINERPHDLTVSISAFIKGNRESSDKAERLQEVWNNKRAELGERRVLTRQGPRWFDFVADDPGEPLVGEWRPNERAEVVRRIFRLCAEGLGKEAIATKLNAEGVKAFRHGDGWNASSVLELLRDRRVLGEYQLHTKVDALGNPCRRRPIGEPLVGYFPAVVSEEAFYAAQAALAARYTGARATKVRKVPNLFVGLGYCACGRKMEFRDKNTTNLKRGYHSEKAVYLICSGAQRGHACANKLHHTYAALERMVLDWVSDITINDEEADAASDAEVRLAAKAAERDDLKRRFEAAFAKWDAETDEFMREAYDQTARRHRAALKTVEAEIAKLEEVARTSKRTVQFDRRAAVRRLRDEIAGLSGDALFEARAKLASALREVIERVEFDLTGVVSVKVRGAERRFDFWCGELVEMRMRDRETGLPVLMAPWPGMPGEAWDMAVDRVKRDHA